MVRMWPYSFSLTWLTIAASVVDLPEPVGPVTRIRPRGRFVSLGEDLGRRELLERQHLRRNRAERGGRAALLVERVDAEAREVRHREAEVALEVFLVLLALMVAHDVVHHGVDVLVLHRRQVDPPHIAVDPDQRRQARRQMQVGGLVLDREGEELGDVHL